MGRSRAIALYRGIRSALGRVVHEGAAHLDRVRQPAGQPRAMFFASQADSGGSGYLRARGVGLALRVRGWRTVMPSAALSLRQRLRLVSSERPDVIVLQQARHPLNRPGFYPGVPCVLDLDDADILDPRCADDVIECVLQSRAAVAGSRFVADLLRPYNRDVSVIWTCVDRDVSRPVPPSQSRGPVVAWASLSPSGFSHEAELIQKAMIELAGRTRFTFRLYGTRDRWGVRSAEWADRYVAPIQEAGADIELIPLLDYDAFLQSLESVAVGLQPVCIENDHSRGRSFGKILAYLTSGAAVVASNAVDHPLFFRSLDNGIMIENDAALWTEACAALLADPALRARLADAGRADLGRRLVASSAAEQLEPVLRRAIEGQPLAQVARQVRRRSV